MNVENVSGTARTIAATGDTVEPGDVVDVDGDLARSLFEQGDVWAKPTTKKSDNDKEA